MVMTALVFGVAVLLFVWVAYAPRRSEPRRYFAFFGRRTAIAPRPNPRNPKKAIKAPVRARSGAPRREPQPGVGTRLRGFLASIRPIRKQRVADDVLPDSILAVSERLTEEVRARRATPNVTSLPLVPIEELPAIDAPAETLMNIAPLPTATIVTSWTRLIDPERSSLSAEERVRTIDHLGVLGEGWCESIIMTALREDPDVDVRIASLRAIAAARYDDARGVIVDGALFSETASERVAAINALAALHANAAIELALTDNDSTVAIAAASALCAGMAPHEASDYLERILDKETANELVQAVTAPA